MTTATPVAPLRRNYDAGPDHEKWLDVLRLIRQGQTPYRAAKLVGMPRQRVYDRIARGAASRHRAG